MVVETGSGRATIGGPLPVLISLRIRAMKLRPFAGFALVSSLSWMVACSAAGTDDGSKTKDVEGTGSTSNLGGSPNLQPGGNAGTLNVNVSGASGVKDPNDPRDVPVRQKTCDTTGTVCTCLRLGLLGTLDSAAVNKDTQPFIDWLNGSSDGTATVTMVATKPAIDEAFLAKYDILLVAN